jgi:hydrogenase-4 component F
MILELMVVIPIITAGSIFFTRSRRQTELVSTAGILALFAIACYMVYDVMTNGNLEYSIWYLDSLSAYMLFIIAFIGLMAGIYSVPYIAHEVKEKELSVDRAKYYYMLFHIFMFTMLMVVVSNNLGIMWIAIEATTLASAFLVGFTENDMAVEAAWKYLIICSVGITLALFGTILAYASSITALGESSDALNWSRLMAEASHLDPTLLKISFILIMVGYGTKVGLAPMHTWLPDAHSQAPTPVSALLSGVLLNCAMYGIIRFHMITSITVPGFSSTLLLIFGLVSIAVAAAFIITARDFKRLLAYSSIEHMGIIAFGFGIGGFLGIFGALLHMLNHALTKCLMFFGAGNLLQKFKTREIAGIRGVSTLMPMTAVIFIAGAMAITGSPPFSIFLSEVTILTGGLSATNYLAIGIYVVLLSVIFAAFMYHVSKMMFGEPTEGIPKGELEHSRFLPMGILLVIILVMGIFIPSQLNDLLVKIASLFGASPQVFP